MQCVVDACTNVITGRYANIVLVITDRTSDSYQAGQNFQIRQAPAINVPVCVGNAFNNTYGNFSTDVYQWMGRIGQVAANVETCLPLVWQHLCETISLPGMSSRVITMASELCYKRRMAGLINPGVLAQDERRHQGLHAYGDVHAMIDGTNMHNIQDSNNAWRTSILRSMSTLAHSPYGMYPNSAVYIGTGNNHVNNIPSYNTQRYREVQYRVNQSSNIGRLAVAIWLIVRVPDADRVFTVNDMNVRCQATASLLLGIGGWIHTGISAGIVSGWGTNSNYIPQWLRSELPTASDNFIVDVMGGEATGIAAENAVDANYNLISLIQALFVQEGIVGLALEVGQMNVPWWYIEEVMNKFDFQTKFRTKRRPHRFPIGVAGISVFVLSFEETSHWTDLHMATCDLSYETRHWQIQHRPSMDAAMGEPTINCWPDHYIDTTRKSVAAGNALALQVPAWGVLGTTITFGDYAVKYQNNVPQRKGWSNVMIWGDTPIEHGMETIPKIVGGLKYPDPLKDWLWEGVRVVGPHIITGDLTAATVTALAHITEPAITWAGDKIAAWLRQTFQ